MPSLCKSCAQSVRLGLSNLSSCMMTSTSVTPCMKWRRWNTHQLAMDAVIHQGLRYWWNAPSSGWQVMNLIGNRRAPKRTTRSVCAKAGSPKRREPQGDGTLIVIGQGTQRRIQPMKEQPTKVSQSTPGDSGVQGRYQEVHKRRGMRNADN